MVPRNESLQKWRDLVTFRTIGPRDPTPSIHPERTTKERPACQKEPTSVISTETDSDDTDGLSLSVFFRGLFVLRCLSGRDGGGRGEEWGRGKEGVE